MPAQDDRPPRTFSLRAYLLLLVIGTMAPALVVAGFLVQRVVADNREAVSRQLLETARAEAAIVDAELGGSIRALQGLAESDHLTNHELAAFYVQCERLLATQVTWSAVNLATPDGRQVAYTARPLGSSLPMVTDRDSFDRAVTTKTAAIGNLRFISPVHIGKRIRARAKLISVDEVQPNVIQQVSEITVEIEGESKPAMVAESVMRSYLDTKA